MQMIDFTIAGIDYGSKLAGTTAIAYNQGPVLYITQSTKGQNADQFVVDVLTGTVPQPLQQVFLDAPLSLPLAYRQPVARPDFMFRAADRAVGAMSPMFLGGLTARAMALQHQLSGMGIACHEAYPSALARVLLPHLHPYKKAVARLTDFTEAAQLVAAPYTLAQPPQNGHQLDALLAWKTGLRYHQGQHQRYGHAAEGVILV